MDSQRKRRRKTQFSEEKQCVGVWYLLVTTIQAAALLLSSHIPRWIQVWLQSAGER